MLLLGNFHNLDYPEVTCLLKKKLYPGKPILVRSILCFSAVRKRCETAAKRPAVYIFLLFFISNIFRLGWLAPITTYVDEIMFKTFLTRENSGEV